MSGPVSGGTPSKTTTVNGQKSGQSRRNLFVLHVRGDPFSRRLQFVLPDLERTGRRGANRLHPLSYGTDRADDGTKACHGQPPSLPDLSGHRAGLDPEALSESRRLDDDDEQALFDPVRPAPGSERADDVFPFEGEIGQQKTALHRGR
jgi:hypothetical protein